MLKLKLTDMLAEQQSVGSHKEEAMDDPTQTQPIDPSNSKTIG